MTHSTLAPVRHEGDEPTNVSVEWFHLYDLLRRRARAWPDAPVLGGQDDLIWRTLSGRELIDLVDGLASQLAALGIGSGDRVVVWLPNHWRTPVYLFALWKLGAVVVPFDREMNPEAAARIIDSVAARCVVVGSGERPAWVRGAGLIEWWEPDPVDQASVAEKAWTRPDEDLALISFTSGTTGEPKGCMISHANLLVQVHSCFERIPVGPGSRFASILPLSHLFELTAGLLYPLAAGAAVHYVPSRRGPDIVRVLAEQHITHMMVVPQLLAAMGEALETRLAAALSPSLYQMLIRAAERLPMTARRRVFWPIHRRIGGQLGTIVCGGAPLPVATQRFWELLGVRVIQGYGTSECSPGIAVGRADGTTPPGSVGPPLRGVEVRVDSDGELLVRGPNVMAGYWKDPARTAAVLRDGWYATGDLARIDDDGNIWLMGRARDLIVLPSGLKVWPDDVEAVLRSHPAVKDAVVLAVPASGGGASLHAYLLRAGGCISIHDVSEIVAVCNARLAQHQRVASASWWEGDDFPRTALLKVRRHLLPLPKPESTVEVESILAADDPVSQAIAGVARVPAVGPEQTLGDLAFDSLRLVELALALEEKTGKPVGDADLRLEMTVEQVRGLLLQVPAAEPAAGSQPLVQMPLWPYTWGRSLRFLSAPLDLLYRLSITRTTIVGVEHLRGLPAGVIVAGTHHSFPDLPLVRYALARSGAIKTDRMVTAIAAGGFNSGGPSVTGLGLYLWYGILALGLYPLHQEANREASLRGLARVAAVGNSIAIFPQGVHATRAAERAGDPTARFRPGVAHLARALRAPVVPFGLAGTEAVMPYAPAQFHGRLIAGIPISIRRGPLAIAFGAPLSISPSESPEDFTLRLQAACLALTRQAEAALG